MALAQNYQQNNPYLEDSILGEKYFNPDYLFQQGVEGGQSFGRYASNFDASGIFHNILFFLLFFFLTVIAYTIIRMFEIRAKEHKHLEHELHEYAHHQAELAKKKEKAEESSQNPRWR